MKERTLNIIALSAAFALIGFAFYVGCRALNNDRMLWLFAAAGVQSPRGAETFAAPANIIVQVEWDQVQYADGYKVYLRKMGQTYTFGTLTTNTNLRIYGLQRKTTYKCAVTYRHGNYESKMSEEVTFRTGNNQSAPVEEL